MVIGTLAILAMMVAFDVVCISSGYDGTKVLDWPLLSLLPIALLCSFFAIGITVLWLGMIWDCAFISKLPISSKLAWLILLALTFTFGALIYYFCVYKNRPLTQVLAEVNPHV